MKKPTDSPQPVESSSSRSASPTTPDPAQQLSPAQKREREREELARLLGELMASYWLREVRGVKAEISSQKHAALSENDSRTPCPSAAG